jgi:hypothetical protein
MQDRLVFIYEQSGISASRDLAYLPKRVAAKGSRRHN